MLEGEVNRSVLFYGVTAGKDSLIAESVVMPNVRIGEGARVYRAIIGEGAVVQAGVTIGSPDDDAITIVAIDQYVTSDHLLQEVEHS
ncbi:Glucose-1-phosphate adenylyltransferase [compost metagenome]